MGKSRDKLYITHGEWRSGEYGGLSREQKRELEGDRIVKRLPFDHCSLSLQPFKNPVATPQGVIFDLSEVERYIRLQGDDDGWVKCPVTGTRFKFSDLFKLIVHKNQAGEYACPVSGRVFGENVKIMVNKKTGHVYSEEAVTQMCTSGFDFMTEKSCRRSDFIVLCDPRENVKLAPVNSSSCTSNSFVQSNQPIVSIDLPQKQEIEKGLYSSGKMAASLTSTVLVNPTLKQEISQPVQSSVPRPLRNARIVLRTTHGDCEATLYAPMMPVTVYNFVQRAIRGDYVNTPVYSKTDSLILCGSLDVNSDLDLPCKTRETPHKNLRHTSAGFLGMCEDETGDTHQFYITLTECPSLDRVNRLFGRVDVDHLGSKQTIDRIRRIAVNLNNNEPLEYAAILDIIVMYDPFSESEKAAMAKMPLVQSKSVTKSVNTIGKYLTRKP